MTVFDGTDTFAGSKGVSSDRINKTVLWRGTTLPLNPVNEVPVDGLFLKTDTGEIYQNTGDVINPVWALRIPNIDSVFGDGSDGDAINPVLNGGDIKQYNNLTIDSNVSWGGSGIIIIRVKETFDLQSGNIITINTDGDSGTSGGFGGSNGGDGGNGGNNRATVIIIAKTITGTGTIQSTGDDGLDGGDAAAPVSPSTGNPGTDNNDTRVFGIIFEGPQGGKTNAGGIAGENYTESDLSKVIDLFLSHYQDAGGCGGSEGRETIAADTLSGGGGGAGGCNGVEQGGKGGNGISISSANNSTGGGGGGGGAASLLVIITKTITAINIILTGGDGGDGGLQSGGPAGRGGGGGGGTAALILIAEIDNVNDTLTGGSGGDTSSAIGDDGVSKKVFDTFTEFQAIIKRPI